MKKLLFAVLLIAGTIWLALVIHFNSGPVRTREVRTLLDEIPDTKVTYISDLSKQASQSISALLELPDSRQIGFTHLDKGDFRNSPHIHLLSIGSFHFRNRIIRDGQEGYWYDIDVGSGGPIPEVSELGITNIQSALLHYDTILSCVLRWPATTNEWPTRDEEILFKDDSGNEYYYARKISQQDLGQVSPEPAPEGAAPNEPSR